MGSPSLGSGLSEPGPSIEGGVPGLKPGVVSDNGFQ